MLPLSKIAGGDNPADLMTKNVGIDLAIKHMRAMGIRFEQGRSSAAAHLHMLQRDCWQESGNILKRWHVHTRKELFTPKDGDCPFKLGVVCALRRTIGKTAAGIRFVIEDNWRRPDRARRELEESWTGYTEFQLKCVALP